MVVKFKFLKMSHTESDFIVETEQIRRSLNLINEIEIDKFPILADRIANKIHSNEEASFKAQEIEKLEKSLNLTNENVLFVIDLLEFIFLQAAYELIKPAALKQKLVNLNLNDDKANCIAEIWKESGKKILEKIRQTKTISHKCLKNINWRLNFQLATDSKTKQKLPNALFELKLVNPNEKSEQSVHVEFSRDELFKLMNKLETIQKQLDALSSN